MAKKLKPCPVCETDENVEVTEYERTVKYHGKEVTYTHHGHRCNLCKSAYDEAHVQTDVNEAALEAAYQASLTPEDKRGLEILKKRLESKKRHREKSISLFLEEVQTK